MHKIAIALALLLVTASVAACGGDSESGSSTTANTTTAQGTDTATTGTTGTTTSAVKLNEEMTTLVEADGAEIKSEKDLEPYRDALAKAKEKCPKVGRARIARLAAFVKKSAEKNGRDDVTVLKALEAPIRKTGGSCEDKFRRFAKNLTGNK